MLNLLRSLLIFCAAVAACGCADNDFAAPSLLVRTGNADGAVLTTPEPVVREEATPSAGATGAAALHGYRDDMDPSHAAIASYRD
jgi:hypothetical protein